MATENELTRIADMANALRPEWNARSVRHILATGRYGATGPAHRDRGYADLALAVAAVACDPESKTPGRLSEHGHWWAVTAINSPRAATPAVTSPACPDHAGHPAANCPECHARAIPAPAGWRNRERTTTS